WRDLPASLAVSGALSILAACVLLAAGAQAAAGDAARARNVFVMFCLAWLAAGLLNAAVAGVQVFAPQWADGNWIARSSLPGRAIGNLRQPNHLCTLLLWAVIAAIALVQLRVLRPQLVALVLPVLALALVQTASRTAVVGVILLACWGLLDRRLRPAARLALLATPLLYALAWALMTAWSSWSSGVFAGQERLAEADLSSSRFAIWSDTLGLIRAEPWLGVGFGQFNFAWSLTPFEHRPRAFFDHSHNLLLQWAAELGVPLALVLVGLLLATLWRIARAAHQAPSGDDASCLRAALAMLLMMAVHSQLEYPLWYLYFLLPTAWLLGFAATRAAAAAQEDTPAAGAMARRARRPWPLPAWSLQLGGFALALGSLLSVLDYQRVVVIFDSRSHKPLSQRIQEGQRSLLFGHHADYAAATVAPQPERELAAFGRASHYLLDTRLMTAWAEAWAAKGDLRRAQHLAQRLREFRNPLSDDYFAPCKAAAPAAPAQPAPTPYQCAAPGADAPLEWRDFR
ncbi:MAG: O-antigen ligase C-terminal domain-containing protein, partial [Rubrivivax sp.]|nr:O-antigen ligase C-terminal domain-containing protein [Rubrivivax sp.]